MSGSTVWVSSDIGRIAEGGIARSPAWDFAAGVAWLAGQLNAPVKLAERREPVAVVVLDANGREVRNVVCG